ncbi:transposase [Hymenobacter aerilatus]|uniref:Transposase n=1 Tax=Hymenobacter aerilatus TaxID=2932251 RepID=A0A8T9T1M0_9BACT|nr:transposase [Hymenobacter aerilatus]UOR06450.1 transposase [Hymenobacter aerilatus]
MAKTIKPLQCPTCGSPHKADVRPDVYHCQSCGTEYFLDSDDITITLRQQPTAAHPPASLPQAVWQWVLLGMVLVGLLFGVAMWLFRPSRSASVPVATWPPALPPRWGLAHSLLLLGPKQQPVLVVAGNHNSGDSQAADSALVVFYNATTGKRLRRVALAGQSNGLDTDLHLKSFSDGTVHVLYHRTLYRLSTTPPALEDVTEQLLGKQRALASGVASLDLGSNEYDRYQVFTNDGHHLTYYPLIARTYTEDEHWKAERGLSSLRPDSKVRPRFTFTKPSFKYPDAPIQLVAYQVHDNGGGPRVHPDFSWQDDYGGPGSYTDADPHTKRLISREDAAISRLISYRDFTPGRLYFAPSVLFHDADVVLITCQANAAADSPQVVQALDARTGRALFTTPLPAQAPRPRLGLRYPGGFVIGRDQTTYTLSPTGKLGPVLTYH